MPIGKERERGERGKRGGREREKIELKSEILRWERNKFK